MAKKVGIELQRDIDRQRLLLGQCIRTLRKEQGFSQYQFCKMIDMDRTYLIGVEKGRRNVTFNNIAKIAAGLGLNAISLMQRIDIEMQELPSDKS